MDIPSSHISWAQMGVRTNYHKLWPPPCHHGPFTVIEALVPREDGKTHYIVSPSQMWWMAGTLGECLFYAGQWNTRYATWLMVRGTKAEEGFV